LDSTLLIQPFYQVSYFDWLQLKPMKYWEFNSANKEMSLFENFTKSGFNLLDFDTLQMDDQNSLSWLKTIQDSIGFFSISHHFSDENLELDYPRFLQVLPMCDQMIEVAFNYLDSVPLNDFRKTYGFKGFFVVKSSPKNMLWYLANGADYIRLKIPELNRTDPYHFNGLKVAQSSPEKSAKSMQKLLINKVHLAKQSSHSKSVNKKEFTRLNIISNSTNVLKMRSNKIPINKGFNLIIPSEIRLSAQIKKENNIRIVRYDFDEKFEKELAKNTGQNIIVLPEDLSAKQIAFIVPFLSSENIVFCCSNPAQLSMLNAAQNLVYFILPENKRVDYLIQQLTGRISISGDMYESSKKINKIKLARTDPAFCNMDEDSLRKIDQLISNAIRGEAFPGCQVLIAKNGCIIYDKSFGHHTYEKQQPVSQTSLYDVASLTKVVATTIVGMKLYDLKLYELTDSIQKFLPDSLDEYLPYPSTIRHITFSELFTHKSGLPAGFPLIKYMTYTTDSLGRFDKYFCDRPDSLFSVEVAADFYLENEYQDSMWLRLNQLWLDKSKPFKYSDVNMNVLYQLFDAIIENNAARLNLNKQESERIYPYSYFEDFLYTNFYTPLSMFNTRYLPLKVFEKSRIVPTENDRFWRKQLLQGHVHDPNAALLGGVAGNAGIFSTTNDLAILCELLRQKGAYGGQPFISAETVQKFTAVQPNSHRGLGFNKSSFQTKAFGCADSSSLQTYGHTGFTGTCFWIDPENDLTFIFLSNRVHPRVTNTIYQYSVRKKIHQYAYDALR
jgi:CubicO group peptidase (beta-lactamase class C family)